MVRSVILFIALLPGFLSPAAFASDWKFLTEKEGIKVYSRAVSGSKIKALKVECTVNATLSGLTSLLLDIPATKEWVYHTKSCTLLKQVSSSELYYYSEVSLPWPLDNRDFVAHVKVTQDKASGIVTVNAPAIPGWVAQKKGIVRVSQSVGYWVITPLDKSRTKVEYSLQVDPGGIIPAWAVNLLSSQGPIESFMKMRQQLLRPAYRDARLDFIRDY